MKPEGNSGPPFLSLWPLGSQTPPSPLSIASSGPWPRLPQLPSLRVSDLAPSRALHRLHCCLLCPTEWQSRREPVICGMQRLEGSRPSSSPCLPAFSRPVQVSLNSPPLCSALYAGDTGLFSEAPFLLICPLSIFYFFSTFLTAVTLMILSLTAIIYGVSAISREMWWITDIQSVLLISHWGRSH